MQKFWLIGTDWDEDLPHGFVQSSKEYLIELKDISRGCGPLELASHPLYWNGSELLSRPPSGWPPNKVDPNLEVPEEKHQSIALTADAAPSFEEIYRQFSNCTRFLRTIAGIRKCKTKAITNEKLTSYLTSKELEDSRIVTLRQLQVEHFQMTLQN